MRNFGGEFNSDAEYRWNRAMQALEAVAKARPDSALALVAFELADSTGDRIFEATQFAESVGRMNDPNLSTGVDEWEDEQYEAVTGRKRPVKS
jgi:hypothetical protein